MMSADFDFDKMLESGLAKPLWDSRAGQTAEDEYRAKVKRDVDNRIAALPERARQILEWHHAGQSFGQIAVRLGRPHRDRGIICRSYQRAMKQAYGPGWRQVEADRQAKEHADDWYRGLTAGQRRAFEEYHSRRAGLS